MKQMFRILLILSVFFCVGCIGCENDIAAFNQQNELNTAKYRSEYAIIRPKLNMLESSFKERRRVVFYNVRLGETVFACEGYIHIQIDEDGDVELVVKTGENEYLRHYLMPRQDITYFSEQVKGNYIENNYSYEILWNPSLWVPKFTVK